MEKKYSRGFIQGTFDMFHIGHLNLIKRAKEQCEYLIVGVNTDELVQEYKNKTPIIKQDERIAIVQELKSVDETVLMKDRDKLKAAKELNFDVNFMGDDWKGTEFYNKVEEELKKIGVDIVYFPYTKGTSSTILRQVLEKRLEQIEKSIANDKENSKGER